MKTEKRPAAAPILPLAVFTALAPFVTGLFYEWQSALAALFLLAYLLYVRKTVGKLRFPAGSALFAALGLCVLLLLSPLWAVDRGMAIFGLVKFLPLPLFVFALGQTEPSDRERLLDWIAPAGALMVLLSLPLSYVPVLRDYLTVNGRLAGFFQYPNSFAAYLMTGLILLSPKLGKDWKTLACFVLLLAGILLSGSRAVFVLTVLALVLIALFVLKGRERRLLLLCGGGVLAAALVYALLSGNLTAVGRFLTASLRSSTLLGRLLYAKDALPVILRHPLGLGYLGYHYSLGSFQTGVYSLLNIHNELLQLLLDAGWLAGGLGLWALWAGFRRWKGAPEKRIALALLCAHCLFDFNLQFLALDFVLLLFLDTDGKKQPKPERLRFFPAFCGLLAALCLWLGADSFLLRTGRNEAALKLYDGCTEARIALLPEAETAEEMETLADGILARNDYVSLAHSAKARAAYSRGDAAQMIVSKQRAIDTAKYSNEEYEDFREMLTHCLSLYEAAGASEDAETCRALLADIDEQKQAVLAATDPLAWLLDDKPELSAVP